MRKTFETEFKLRKCSGKVRKKVFHSQNMKNQKIVTSEQIDCFEEVIV